MIADVAGISRGKAMPLAKFMREDRMFLPTSVFHQTIAGDYVDMEIANQWTESDMVLKPTTRRRPRALGRRHHAAGDPQRRGPVGAADRGGAGQRAEAGGELYEMKAGGRWWRRRWSST